MILGFTGTQNGMTRAQKATFWDLITSLCPSEFHHGDCIGADEQAHNIVRDTSIPTYIVSHPPENPTKRADCTADHSYPPLDYLARDRAIVAISDALVATPSSFTETIRSGTWYTVRQARKAKKPITIIWPDGTLTKE